MLLIFRHLKFHLASLNAQRAACYGISIIDKRHFTYLLQGIFVSFTGKNAFADKVFFEKVSYGNSSADFPLCLSPCAFYLDGV
ncbi:MAG: hypothetical protein C4538_02290 [Nitrospiraceae bacterium]|nr:MAG: hypothetical protein C4538_02290 [Nitrospiraceae bacterium]